MKDKSLKLETGGPDDFLHMKSQFIVPNLQTELITGRRMVCDESWAQGGRQTCNDPFSRLYWIEKGKGEIVLDSGARMDLRPGWLFAVPDYTPARYRAVGGMVLSWIHFRAKLFGCLEIFSHMLWPYSVAVPELSEMINLWSQLIALCSSRRLEDALRADGILRNLLSFFAASAPPAGENRLMEIRRFLPAISFIEQNLHRPIRLEELTRSVPLQPAYFCSLFSKTIGQSPIDFINRKRIEKAQFLLLEKKPTLKELAAEVGFKDVYYFSRMFKKIAGIAPAHYRLQERHRE